MNEIRIVQVQCSIEEKFVIEETLNKAVDMITDYFGYNMSKCSINIELKNNIITLEFKANIIKDDTENFSRKG